MEGRGCAVWSERSCRPGEVCTKNICKGKGDGPGVYCGKMGGEEMSNEPVPLTPEVLERAGFVWNETLEHWVLEWGRESIHFVERDGRLLCFLVKFGQHHYQAIHNLHQLQNFYHERTGKELEVTF